MRYLGQTIDFTGPDGAQALCEPDSVSWRIFKNPVTLAVGGITAVILELAEPRVRHGVWDHSIFEKQPLTRMKRTGLAAMITVYAPEEIATQTIGRIGHMHAGVSGTTPCGKPYRASDLELMNWVQATASFGFLEAYHALAGPLSEADRDRLYSEAQSSAALYGATHPPASVEQQVQLFDEMAPLLEPSAILTDFLAIVQKALPMPGAGLYVRAAIELLPEAIRRDLGLEPRRAKPWMMKTLRVMAKAADRLPVPGAPPVQACRRMGLPGSYLYRGRKTANQTPETLLHKS